MSNLLTSPIVLDPDILRLAFVLGIVVSALIYDRFHLTTGSILVPGYLGATILDPILTVMTFANACLVFWIVYKLLPRYFLMGGQSKFLLVTSLSAGFQFLLLQVSGPVELYLISIPLISAIGFVIPGLIAHDFARHGISKTLVSTVVAGFIVGLAVVLAVLSLGGSLLLNSSPQYPNLSIDLKLIGLALLLSVLAASALQHNHGLRSGGFVGSGYLAILLVSPLDSVYLLALSLATYYLVTRFLMKREMVLFGQRKFTMMMLCSVVLSWGALLVIERGIGYGGLIISLMPMAGMFLPGLFANDMERVGILKVSLGTGLVITFTLATVFLFVEMFGQHRTQPMIALGLLSAFTSLIIFVPFIPTRLARRAT